MCMWDDSEPYHLYESAERRAIKDHTCEECNRTIAKGETYRWAKGFHPDWGFTVHKRCAQCVEVCRWLDKVCGGWMHGVVIEDLWMHITGEEAEERNAPLVRVGRWQQTGWRDRTGELRPVGDLRALVDRALSTPTAADRWERARKAMVA